MLDFNLKNHGYETWIHNSALCAQVAHVDIFGLL